MSQVAAQLYTLKGHTETEQDIAVALKRVREMGYGAVQVSGLGPIKVEILAKLLSDNGLTCCATHEPSDQILDNPSAVAERLNALGCTHTAYPYPGGIDLHSETEIKKWIVRLDKAGETLRNAGVMLSYHNHQIEFRKVGGKTILDMIFDGTSPDNVKAELDTYWCQYGGMDPVQCIQNLPGRQPLIHLKDYMIDQDFKPQYADIGGGTLNMPAIIAAAEAVGTQWFIIERDPCPGDPFDSLKASYEYLERVVASG